jgi:hypothetical protein
MRVTRPALCLALAASVVASGAANAAAKKPAPKPVCNLLVDSPTDSKGTPASGSDKAMEITSVDIASDKNVITGVLRLAGLSATSSNAPTGMNWSVSFTAGDNSFSLAAHAGPTGTLSYDAAYSAPTGGSIYGDGVTGAFDVAKKEIRVTAPLSLLAPQTDIKVGSKITDLAAGTGQEILVPDATKVLGGGTIFSDAYGNVDTAEGGKTYVAGAKSCVTPGK